MSTLFSDNMFDKDSVSLVAATKTSSKIGNVSDVFSSSSSTSTSTSSTSNLADIIREATKVGALRGSEKALVSKKAVKVFVDNIKTANDMEGLFLCFKALPFQDYMQVVRENKAKTEKYLKDTQSKALLDDLASIKNLKKSLEFMIKMHKAVGDDFDKINWTLIANEERVKTAVAVIAKEWATTERLGRGIGAYSKLTYSVMPAKIAIKFYLACISEPLKWFNQWKGIQGLDTIDEFMTEIDKVLQPNSKVKPANSEKKIVTKNVATIKEYVAHVKSTDPIIPIHEMVFPSAFLLRQCEESRKGDPDVNNRIATILYAVQHMAFGKLKECKSLDKEDAGVKYFFLAHKKISFCLRYATKRVYGSGANSSKIVKRTEITVTNFENMSL